MLQAHLYILDACVSFSLSFSFFLLSHKRHVCQYNYKWLGIQWRLQFIADGRETIVTLSLPLCGLDPFTSFLFLLHLLLVCPVTVMSNFYHVSIRGHLSQLPNCTTHWDIDLYPKEKVCPLFTWFCIFFYPAFSLCLSSPYFFPVSLIIIFFCSYYY